jgi:hypothetical protein
VYAKIVTWRLASDVQDDGAYDRFIRELSERNVPALRKHGLLDGFVVRTAPDMIMTINLYDDQQSADSAWNSVISSLSDELQGKLTLVERKVGAAVDLPMLLNEV